jgi:diadenosine tetraphosphate (Ap4A) HIT family hydrolase
MKPTNGWRQMFQSIPLPEYAAPGQRSSMGRFNDRAYEMQQAILQEELAALAAQNGLAAALRALYEQQVDIGFIQDDLSQVSYFRYRAGDSGEERFFIVQYNPRRAERHKGAGRKTPPPGSQVQGIGDITCFLCRDNIRWQHRGIQVCYHFEVNGRPYNALCNPFPFMRVHLTIAAQEHISQTFHSRGQRDETQRKIRRIVEDLYGVASQLPTFVGFYNGAGAGASIERHLHYHFFEIPDGHGAFPIQHTARLSERNGHQATTPAPGVSKLKLTGYPLTAFRLRGPQAGVIDAAVQLAAAWDELSGEAASANMIMLWEEDAISLYFVPRNKFYTRSPGLAGTVAGLESMGEFIFCTESEYQAVNDQRVDYAYLWRILEAVRPHESTALS